MNRLPDHDPTDQIERLQLKHEICETALSVSSALRIEREPDEYFIEFHIDYETVVRNRGKLPAAVTNQLAEIESVSLEFRYTDPQARPTVCVTITDIHNNFSSCVKHEDTPGEMSFSQTVTYSDFPPAPAVDVPSNSFNRFLAALIYPSKTGDFSYLDTADMFGQRASQSLIESLRKRYETHEEVEYQVPHLGCIVQGASIDDELTRLTVAYSIPRTNIEHSLKGRGLEADIFTTDQSSSISIGKIENISNPDRSTPIKPTGSDYRVLKAVLDEVLRVYQSSHEVSLDRLIDLESADEPIRDKTQTRLLIGEDDSEQSGFDSPDTSA